MSNVITNEIILDNNNMGTIPENAITPKPNEANEAKENVLKGKFATNQIYTELGLVDDDFTIQVEKETPDGLTQKVLHTIFSENKEGDLIMTPYNLNRTLWQKDIPKSKEAKMGATRQVTYSITRVAEPDKYGKYKYPSKEVFADTMPLVPPKLLIKFENKERVKREKEAMQNEKLRKLEIEEELRLEEAAKNNKG